MDTKQEFVKTYYSVTNITRSDRRSEVIRLGGSRNTEQVIASQSFSNTNALWNFQPPSPQTIVSRDWRVRFYIEVAPVGGNFAVGSDCLSSFPLHSILQNAQLSINGASTSAQLFNIAPALLTMTTPAGRKEWHSSTASQPDLYQRYQDGTGSNNEPFARYGSNVLEHSRASFPFTAGVAPNSRRYVISEALLLSPLLSGESEDEGFINVNQFQLILQFTSSLQQIWSHNTDPASGAAAGYTGVTVSFYNAPELLLTYITPSPTYVLPPSQTLEYYQPLLSTQSSGVVLPGASVAGFSCQSQQLNQVPRRMMIFVRQQNPTSFTTQSFCRIDNISVNFANVSGLFASATAQQLWKMSERNGCNISWVEYQNYRGSVIIVDFGKDIGLDSDLAPGTQGLFQIQPTISFTNTSGSNFTPEVNVVYILQGQVTIVPNACRFTLGNITRQIVMDTSTMGVEIPISRLDTGGNFWSKLKNTIGKVARFISPALAAINPSLGTISQGVASLTGNGLSGGMMSPNEQHMLMALQQAVKERKSKGGRLKRIA